MTMPAVLVNVCRICMEEDFNLVNLSTPDDDFIEHGVKLYFCVPTIKIDNESYPQQVCNACITDLRSAYKFKQKCLNSMYLISEILKREQNTDVVMTIKEEVSEEQTQEETEDVHEEIAVETIAEHSSEAGKTLGHTDNEIDDDVEDLLTETFENAIKEEYDDDHCYSKTYYDESEQIQEHLQNRTEECMLEDSPIKKEPPDEENTSCIDPEEHLRESVLHPIFPSLVKASVAEESDPREPPEQLPAAKEVVLSRFSPRKGKAPLKHYYCTLCRVGFDKADFAKHRYVHRALKKITCPLCKREFKCVKDMGRFFRHYCPQNSMPAFMLTCTVCYRKFKSSQALANHKKIHDYSEVGFKCQFCHLYFNSMQKLDWHYRNGVHADQLSKKIKKF